ncbi:MAG: glycosyltransferase [Armatimonadota bacterium]
MNTSKTPSVLMAVFGHIEYDGRVQRAAEALSKSFNVTVISVASHNNYKNPLFDSITVRVPGNKSYGAKQFFSFAYSFIGIAKRLHPDIVYSHDYYLPFPGFLAARFIRSKYIYDAHELYIPEDSYKLNMRARFFYIMERFSIRKAHLVIAANKERALLMKEHFGLIQTPVSIRNIPPQNINADRISVLDNYPLLKKSSRIKLIYQGDIALHRGIDRFIYAMKGLVDSCELILVGGGQDLPIIKDLVDELDLNGSIKFVGKVLRDDLQQIIRSCDIGIITYNSKGYNNIYCSPNKLYEYTQAGLPVIVTAQPPLKEAVEGYGIGVVCGDQLDPSVDDITKAIHVAAKEMHTYKLNIPRFLHDNDWNNEADKLLSAVQSIL